MALRTLGSRRRSARASFLRSRRSAACGPWRDGARQSSDRFWWPSASDSRGGAYARGARADMSASRFELRFNSNCARARGAGGNERRWIREDGGDVNRMVAPNGRRARRPGCEAIDGPWPKRPRQLAPPSLRASSPQSGEHLESCAAPFGCAPSGGAVAKRRRGDSPSTPHQGGGCVRATSPGASLAARSPAAAAPGLAGMPAEALAKAGPPAKPSALRIRAIMS